MHDDPRYARIAALWSTVFARPVSHTEAARAAIKLRRKFGKKADAAYGRQFDYPVHGRVRRCWVTRSPSTREKGWPRLVHDISHDIFRYRHPKFRPHDGGHARLEEEMVRWALEQQPSWIMGALKDKPKAKPTLDDKRVALELRLKKWESKAKRAATAIRTVKAKIRTLDRRTRLTGTLCRDSINLKPTDSPPA